MPENFEPSEIKTTTQSKADDVLELMENTSEELKNKADAEKSLNLMEDSQMLEFDIPGVVENGKIDAMGDDLIKAKKEIKKLDGNSLKEEILKSGLQISDITEIAEMNELHFGSFSHDQNGNRVVGLRWGFKRIRNFMDPRFGRKRFSKFESYNLSDSNQKKAFIDKVKYLAGNSQLKDIKNIPDEAKKVYIKEQETTENPAMAQTPTETNNPENNREIEAEQNSETPTS